MTVSRPRPIFFLGCMIVGLLGVAGVASSSAQPYSLPWYTMDGGGGGHGSAGGTFALAGTIGQPDAAVASGGNFILTGGFWNTGPVVTAVGDLPGAAPRRAFQIRGAYPNPFNPRVTFSYELPAARTVRLVVLNARGELVRTLVSENRSAGAHEEIWDGRDQHGSRVASGIYFLQLQAGEFGGQRKVALVK